jgi:hypothetical protein
VLFLSRANRQGSTICWAAVAAVSMDLLDNVPPWATWLQHWGLWAPVSGFHHGIQHNVSSAEWPLGAAVQVAVLAVALAACFLPRRKRIAHTVYI